MFCSDTVFSTIMKAISTSPRSSNFSNRFVLSLGMTTHACFGSLCLFVWCHTHTLTHATHTHTRNTHTHTTLFCTASSFSEGWVVVEETPPFSPGSVPSIAENAAAQVHTDVMRLTSADDGGSVASAAAVTTLAAVFMQVRHQQQHPQEKLQLR